MPRMLAPAVCVMLAGCGGASTLPRPQEGPRGAAAGMADGHDGQGPVRPPRAEPDAPTCESCASGLRISAYRDTGVTEAVDDLDLASRSSGQIAFAWTGTGGARLARLDRRLRVTADPTGAIGPSSARDVALTALTTGWALAVSWSEGSSGFVDLYFVDDEGSFTRRAQLAGFHHAFFGDRESGPLLVLSGPEDTRAVLLDAHARPSWERHIAERTTEPQYASAVFTGESFLVGLRDRGVTLVPVGLDGVVGPRVSPVGTTTEYPQLVWTGSSALVLHAHFGREARLHSLRVDARGTPLGPPVPIGEPRRYFNYSPGVAVGRDEALVLLGGYTGGTGQSLPLDVGLFSGTELTRVPATLTGDRRAVRNYDITRTRSTIVAAWVGDAEPFRGRGRIYVATIE